MADTLVLRFAASHERLRLAEREINELAARERWPDELLFKVKLVVEEIGLNIIDYGYAGDDSGEIEIRFRCEKDTLTIDIIDEAEPFDPLTESPIPNTSAEIEERPVGGLGVHLVKQMMDEVRYAREGNSNRLTLVARIPS